MGHALSRLRLALHWIKHLGGGLSGDSLGSWSKRRSLSPGGMAVPFDRPVTLIHAAQVVEAQSRPEWIWHPVPTLRPLDGGEEFELASVHDQEG